MPQRLEDLVVDEVSLVDRPANSEKGIPRARIALFKRDESSGRSNNPDKGSDKLPPPEFTHEGAKMSMTIEQIEKKLTDQEAELAVLKSDKATLEAETDLVLKMSKKDRKLYASMDTEKRKKFVAGDTEKRKAMMEDAKCVKREATLTAAMDAATLKQFNEGGAEVRKTLLDSTEQRLAAVVAKAAKKKDHEEPDGDEGDDEDEEDDMDEDDMDKKKKKSETAKSVTLKVADASDRITKAEQELATIMKRERRLHFTTLAKSELPHICGKDEDKGERLMKFAENCGGEETELFKSYIDDLKAANKAMSIYYGEVGKAGGAIPAEKAFDARVTEVRKRDNITEAKAVAKVMEENPELYLDYERAKRSLTGI